MKEAENIFGADFDSIWWWDNSEGKYFCSVVVSAFNVGRVLNFSGFVYIFIIGIYCTIRSGSPNMSTCVAQCTDKNVCW